jgi:hypothetical protein
MINAGFAFARAASQPIVSGVRDLAIAATQMLSRNDKSPFDAGVWSGTGAGLEPAFLVTLYFARNLFPG